VTSHRHGPAVIEFPNGLLANFDNEEDLLRSLLDPEGTVSG
jgi:hypothetical protein